MNEEKNPQHSHNKKDGQKNHVCPFCKRDLIPDFLDKQFFLCPGENRRFRLEAWGLSLER